MNANKNAAKTSVVCYFCEVTFENAKLLQGHITQCGSILQRCQHCPLYVERRLYDSHSRGCLKESLSPTKQQRPISYHHTSTLQLPTRESNYILPHDGYRGQNNQQFTNVPPQTNQQFSYANNTLQGENIYNPTMQGAKKKEQTYAIPHMTNSLQNGQSNHLSKPDLSNRNQNYVPPLISEINGHVKSPSKLELEVLRAMSTSVKESSDRWQDLRSEFDKLRKALEEEQNQREQLKNEVSKMKRQYLLSEERSQILLDTISTLRKTIDDQVYIYKITKKMITDDVEKVKTKLEEVLLMTSKNELIQKGFQKDIEREQIERSHLELIVNGQDSRLRMINLIENDLTSVKRQIIQEQNSRKEIISVLQKELTDTNNSLINELTINKQHLKDFEASQSELTEKLQVNSNDISKYQVSNIESKSLRSTVEADSKKVQTIEENIKELRDSVANLQKQRYTSHLDSGISSNSSEYHDFTGHLIWKIADFEETLKDSVDNDSVLLSPVFYSNKYGYALRAEVYLNGQGEWKGRYIMVSVLVVPGKWDPVLDWPAKLSAKVATKHQTPKRSEAIDIIKTLQVRNGDQHSESVKSLESLSRIEWDNGVLEASMKKQYIFIEHDSLDKLDYIKNNVMYMEFIVSSV